MKQSPYQICTRCVLDTSDPLIVFDQEGHCNHCNDYYDRISKLVYQGAESDQQLASLVEEIKNKGKKRKYDCVIGVSGGIDSSYVAYLVKQLGLRPLAVHLDNGWNSEEAVSNIKKICNKLDIDLHSYVLDWDEFRDIQLAVLKSSIVEVEIPTDHAILAALHKVAGQFNVKYIISGGNYATEGLLPNSWFYNAKDTKLLKSIHRQFGKRKMKTFPLFDYKREVYCKFIKGIRMVYILNYVPFSKDQAMETLESKLDWKYYGGKHYESKYTGFAQSYIQFKKFNVDYRRATFSTQICAGTMTREEAMRQLEQKPYEATAVAKEMEYVSKKLGLTVQAFEDIMNQTPKSYRDYPNQEKMLEFFYKTYRTLFSS